MRAGWLFRRCKWTHNHFLSIQYNPQAKRSWFGPKCPIMVKQKTSPLAILARRIYHNKRLFGKLRTERLTSPEAPRGQAQSISRAKLPDSSIMDCPAPAREQSDAHADDPADSAGQSTHGQRYQPRLGTCSQML
jgi:hypothetical protein